MIARGRQLLSSTNSSNDQTLVQPTVSSSASSSLHQHAWDNNTKSARKQSDSTVSTRLSLSSDSGKGISPESVSPRSDAVPTTPVSVGKEVETRIDNLMIAVQVMLILKWISSCYYSCLNGDLFNHEFYWLPTSQLSKWHVFQTVIQ